MEQTRSGDSNSVGENVMIGDLRFDALPEECISKVISRTSPRDACIVSSVSKTVKSAADSDLVWEKFLPAEYSASLVPLSSKKEIYLSLADDSILIDGGKKSLWLEKSSGKKCFMLSAMDLTIVWGDSPDYWQWISIPESKFEKVAKLRKVCWFEIRGKISCKMLSENTHYSVYLVLKRVENRSYGFHDAPVEAEVGFVGKEATKKCVFLDHWDRIYRGVYESSGISLRAVSGAFRMRRSWIVRRVHKSECEVNVEEGESRRNVEEPKKRGDGWSEVELGKIYITNNGGDNCDDEIEISIMETKIGHWKGGLIFQGIEIRPETRI